MGKARLPGCQAMCNPWNPWKDNPWRKCDEENEDEDDSHDSPIAGWFIMENPVLVGS
jgi:hypothetical protein